MPTSYTPILRLAKPAVGELNNTWGTTVNDSVTTMIEEAIAGYKSISMADADYTLTTADGSTDDARNLALRMTGALSAARNVVCPAVPKMFFFTNATTGGFALTLKTATGTGVTVSAGASAVLLCDGTNVIDAVTFFASAIAFASSITVSGATTLANDLTVDTNVLKVDSVANRVGIGTASPGYLLDVAGVASVSTLRFPDNTTQTTAATSTAALPMTDVSGTTQTAVSNNHYVLTNVATSTLTLPASPTAGDVVWVTVANDLTTNVIARNGNRIMGLLEDMTIGNRYQTVQLRYVNTTLGWRML